MLNHKHFLPGLLLIATLAGGCWSHSVDPRPNKTVAEKAHTLTVVNGTAKTITLFAAADLTNEPPHVLAPGGSKDLPFTVRDQINLGPLQEHELVFVPELSSVYVSQNAKDLALRAVFEGMNERKIRVGIGFCLVTTNAQTHHTLNLDAPPLPETLSLHLCPR